MRRGWVRFGGALRVRIEQAEHSTRIETFTMRRGGRIPGCLRRRCELPGGAADRDCDGAPDVPLLPARASLETARRGSDTVLQRLRLRDLQGGEFVALACKGKGCKARLTRTQTVPAGTTRLRLDRVVRADAAQAGRAAGADDLEARLRDRDPALDDAPRRPRRARRGCASSPGENRAGGCG